MKTGSKIKTERTVSYRGFVIVSRIRHQAPTCYRFIPSVSQAPMTSAIPGYLWDRHNFAGLQIFQRTSAVLFRKGSVTPRYVRSHAMNDELPASVSLGMSRQTLLTASIYRRASLLRDSGHERACRRVKTTHISNKWH